MNANDELAARKAFLLTQSALYRAQLRYEVVAARTRMRRGSDWVARGFTIFVILRKAFSIVSSLRK